jgi:small subunit ribosomal protein S13
MVRLLGLVLPEQKRIDYALTLIYGVGWSAAKEILKQTGIPDSKKVSDISEDEFKKIIQVIEKNYVVEGNLREDINENVKRLRDIGAYKGVRHMRGLPVHGQRTKSNSRTKRGKRKTVGALKKEDWAKLEQQKTASKVAAKK